MKHFEFKKYNSSLFAQGLFALTLNLPACVTNMSMEAKTEEQAAADAATEVDAMIAQAEAETTEEEIKDYTVADVQSFDPQGIVVHFEFEKASLSPMTVAALDKIVKGMKKDPLSNITIRAHSDKQGEERYNEKLSARRAKVIKDYLIGHGIDEDRLNPMYLGASEPLDEAPTVNAYKKNRRGEFNINYGPSSFGPSK